MEATYENLKVLIDALYEMARKFELTLSSQERLDASEALMPEESRKVKEITNEMMDAIVEKNLSSDSPELLLKGLMINEIVLPSFERAVTRKKLLELVVIEKVTDEHIRFLEDQKCVWLAGVFRDAKEGVVPQAEARLTYDDARAINRAIENTTKNLNAEFLPEEKDRINAESTEEENDRLYGFFRDEIKRSITGADLNGSPWRIMKSLASFEFSFSVMERAVPAERLAALAVTEGMTEQRVKFLEACKFNSLAKIFGDALAVKKELSADVSYPELSKEDVDPILKAIDRAYENVEYGCSGNEMKRFAENLTVAEDTRRDVLFDELMKMKREDENFMSKPEALKKMLEFQNFFFVAVERVVGSERMPSFLPAEGLGEKHVELLEAQGLSALAKMAKGALETANSSPQKPGRAAKPGKEPGLDND
ncbi:MAG: hypothetical protein PHE27_02530 [Alphaproteobacteria bacterium]|nr:hypothetical protein [Alphaproteobacteria bacterium]